MAKDITPTYEETQQLINKFLGIDNEDEPKKKKGKKKKS